MSGRHGLDDLCRRMGKNSHPSVQAYGEPYTKAYVTLSVKAYLRQHVVLPTSCTEPDPENANPQG